jgi:tetratricopeptide (TPR) repeat protein
MFEELMERAARSARGYSDKAELERFNQNLKQSLDQKRWAAYLHADIYRRIGHFSQAQEWLNIAGELTSEDGPLFWQADIASCQAELELAFDEPQRALEWAHDAWRQHVAVSREALSKQKSLTTLLAEIDHLFTELCRIAGVDANAEVMIRRASWLNDRLVYSVITDASRLISVAGSLGALELARTVATQTIEWSEQLTPFLSAVMSGYLPKLNAKPDAMVEMVLESSLGQMRRILQIEVNTKLGDAEDACNNYENAMRLFDTAAQLAAQAGDTPYWDNKVLQLELNSANQLAKLTRHAEAQAAYERVLSRSESMGSEKVMIACRFGIVGCRWRQDKGSGVLEQQMAIVAELESMFLAAPDDSWARQMLLSSYHLLVNIIAADRAALPAHLPLLLRVLYAIRTPNAVAALVSEGEGAYRSARFAVDILLARWSALKGAVLLVWETGAEDLVLTTLASGGGPLADRIEVACIPIGQADRLADCVNATRDASEQLSMRAIGLKRSSVSGMEQAARDVWNLLPATVRDILAAADTIYYSPSNESILDEFPLEALHDGQDFLGTKKVICRVPSLRHLSELLAHNRFRQAPPARALLVRAKDPLRSEDDRTVQQQVDLIAAGIKNEDLGLQLEILAEPSVDAFSQAAKALGTLLHFVGHGFAGEGGEVLVLSETEQVPIADVVTPSGVRAPFTYFSTCEVGRGRHMSSGAQRGLAATFLDAGAPAILAPAYRIPSHFLGEFAAFFYQQCASLPAGRALQQTRKLLHKQQYHPGCWATLALFGDPLACLTAEAAAMCSARSTPWSSLVFQYLATQDPQRQQTCLEILKADPRLDDEDKSTISQWLVTGMINPQEVGELLERLQVQDGEAAATLNILWTLQEVKDIDSDSTQETQEAARERLQHCLQMADTMRDSYAAVCVIEAYGKVGVPMDSLGSYRQLMDYEQVLLDMLSADAAALERIRTPLANMRQHLDSMVFMNIGTRFGYTDEDIEKADEGDPGALRRVALAMLEEEVHPEALTGVVPWYVWLLRWGGTGTTSACGNVLAALNVDVKGGQLAQSAANAICSLVGELQFSTFLNSEIVRGGLDAVKKDSIEYTALWLMLVKDKIETGGSISLSDMETALALADKLNSNIGPTGIAAWLRTMLAENYLAYGKTERAAEFTQEAVDELAALQAHRKEFTTRLAAAVNLAMVVAEARGDAAGIAQLQEDYADVLAKAGTPDQEIRDDHGHYADYLDDFRVPP